MEKQKVICGSNSIAHPSADILEARSAGTGFYYYVLAKNAKGEYVTWMYSVEFHSFTSGNYFSTEEEARADFLTRS